MCSPTIIAVVAAVASAAATTASGVYTAEQSDAAARAAADAAKVSYNAESEGSKTKAASIAVSERDKQMQAQREHLVARGEALASSASAGIVGVSPVRELAILQVQNNIAQGAIAGDADTAQLSNQLDVNASLLQAAGRVSAAKKEAKAAGQATNLAVFQGIAAGASTYSSMYEKGQPQTQAQTEMRGESGYTAAIPRTSLANARRVSSRRSYYSRKQYFGRFS